MHTTVDKDIICCEMKSTCTVASVGNLVDPWEIQYPSGCL